MIADKYRDKMLGDVLLGKRPITNKSYLAGVKRVNRKRAYCKEVGASIIKDEDRLTHLDLNR